MDISSQDFPPLVPMSKRADKKTAKTRPQPTNSASSKQKTFRQKTKPTTNVHPVLENEASLLRCPEFQENSPKLFQDLTPSNLADLLGIINTCSTQTALDVGLTCTHLNEILKTRNNIWKEVINEEYGTQETLPGISAYQFYRFLCSYKEFEGRYIFNKTAHKRYYEFGPEENLRHIEIELMDIDVSSTGFTMSFLERDETFTTFVKCKPFLEAKLVPNDNGTELLLTSPDEEYVSTCNRKKWQRKDYVKNECTLQEWLFTCTSLYSAISEMIDGRHLVQLHLDGNKHLDPIFQTPDGTWPEALPKPGVFETQIDQVQVTVSYFGRFMIIEQVINMSCVPFDTTILLDLGSAAAIQDGEKNEFTRKEFLAIEKNTNGDPAKMTDVKIMRLTDVYGTISPYRAWYTRVDRMNRDLRMKVMVLDWSCFAVIVDEGQWTMTRQDDIN